MLYACTWVIFVYAVLCTITCIYAIFRCPKNDKHDSKLTGLFILSAIGSITFWICWSILLTIDKLKAH